MIKKLVLLLILYANIAYGATQAFSSNPLNVDTETTVGAAAPIGAMAPATIFSRDDGVAAAADAAPIRNPFLSSKGEVPSPVVINPFTGKSIPEDNLRDLKHPLERKILIEFLDAIRTATVGTTYAQRVELVPNLLTRTLSSPLHALIQTHVAVLENLGIPSQVRTLWQTMSFPADLAPLRCIGIQVVEERAHELLNGVMLGLYDKLGIYSKFVEASPARGIFSAGDVEPLESTLAAEPAAVFGAEVVSTTMAAHNTAAATLPEWALSYFNPVDREATVWRALGYKSVTFMNNYIVYLPSLLPNYATNPVYRESPVGFYLRIGDCVRVNMGAAKGLVANTGGMIADAITAGKIITTSPPLSASLPFYFTAGQAASYGISSGAVLLMPYGLPMGLDAIELASKGDFTQASVKAASSLALLTSPWSIKAALDLRQWPSFFSDQCFPLPWAHYFDQRIGQTNSQLLASIFANPMPVLTTSVSAAGVAYGTYQNVQTLTEKNTNWSVDWKKRLAAVLSLVGNAAYLNTSAVNLGMYTPEDDTLLGSVTASGNTIFLTTTALSTMLRIWDSTTTYHQVKASVNEHFSGAPKPGTMAHAYDTNMTHLSQKAEAVAGILDHAVDALNSVAHKAMHVADSMRTMVSGAMTGVTRLFWQTSGKNSDSESRKPVMVDAQVRQRRK